MSQFFALLVNGLSLGAMYGLVAVGIVLIYRSSHVITFCHGALLLLGAFTVARVNQDAPLVPAVLAGVLVAAVAAFLVERIVIRGMHGSPVITLSIATIGIDLMLLTFLTGQIGSDVFSINHPWGAGTVDLGVVAISTNRLLALLVTVVIVAALLAVLRMSSWGVSVRAAAEDNEVASLMGISMSRITATTWILASVIACVAGVFLAGSPTPGVSVSLAGIALRAFPAALLGGMDSVGGALIGGLLIGTIEAMVAGYQQYLGFLGHGAAQVVPFVVMILVLLVRPSGLFGTKELTRV